MRIVHVYSPYIRKHFDIIFFVTSSFCQGGWEEMKGREVRRREAEAGKERDEGYVNIDAIVPCRDRYEQ